MHKAPSAEEARQACRRRKELFVSSGLRPLQVILSIGLWLLVGSRLWEMQYVHQRSGPGSVPPGMFLVPLIFVVFWVMHFHYMRSWFRTIALVTLVNFISSLPLRADDFALAGYLGQALMLVSAIALYQKMKAKEFLTGA